MNKAVEMYGLAMKTLEVNLADLYKEILVEIHKAASRGEMTVDYKVESQKDRLGIVALANQDGFHTVLRLRGTLITFNWKFHLERSIEGSE